MELTHSVQINIKMDSDVIKELLSYWACASDTWYNCIEYTPESYKKAKEKVIAANPDTTICYEDILYQMLADGVPLGFTDSEDYGTYTLRLADIANGVAAAIRDCDGREWLQWDAHGNLVIDAAELDGERADIILQEALFDSVIYG